MGRQTISDASDATSFGSKQLSIDIRERVKEGNSHAEKIDLSCVQ